MPAAGDARRRTGDQTRRRLLDATRKLLAARGIGGIRLREVAEAAEANMAAVGYHFGSLPNLVDAAVREAADAALDEQCRRLASLPPGAALEDVVASWLAPTVRGLTSDPETGALLRIASRAITEAGPGMRAWAQEVMERAHRQLIDRLGPLLPDLDEEEIAFRVFLVGGIVNRFHTADVLPPTAAVSSPEFERLLVAAIAGMLLGRDRSHLALLGDSSAV
jgi:AcrR family transcriptional regulator